MLSKIPVSCSKDCIGGCPLLAHVEDGRLRTIGNNPAGGPFMAGCIKGFQMPRTVYAPDRLKAPLVRAGPRGSGQFRETSWPAALDLVAEKLGEIKARHGPGAVVQLGASGSCTAALHNTQLLPARFLAMFGGYTRLTSGYSSAALSFMTPYVLGQRNHGVDPATLLHAKLIILWGANYADTRFGCETDAYLSQAKRNGIPIVAIDPRRSASVQRYATQWIPCRPGADTALMMAVLHALISEDMVDRQFADRYSVGFDALERRILGQEDGLARSPAWAEALCGVPADRIVEFARLYGQTRPVALLPGFSIQRTVGGEETLRMGVALQVATGNLGLLGGSSGGRALNGLPGPQTGKLPMPALASQPSVPVLEWPDAVLGGRAAGYPSDIHLAYNVGGNFIVQGSDVRKSIRAFESLEFAVCHDYFLTPTARYCDVVLPTTTFLERQDIVSPASGNYVLFSNRAIAPQGEARNDYDIFCELAGRLGFEAAFSEGKDEEAWLREFVAASEIPDYEEFKRTGIYMAADQERVALAPFRSDPRAHPLHTPSGLVEIASEAYARDTGFSALPEYRGLPADVRYPLQLITPKSKFRIHSQGGNIPWLMAREKQALWIHPRDAGERGIADGEIIDIYNGEGRVHIPAWVTADIMPGVVCLVQGVWPQFDEEGVDLAGCVNVLTSTRGTMPSRGTRTHSVLVQVQRAS
jgi:anaerobic dimethyl sulfoxide reductase subunit A